MDLYLSKLPVRNEEWRQLAAALLGNGDLLGVAANCYVFLTAHAVDAYNLRVKEGAAYERNRLDAARTLPTAGYRIVDIEPFVELASNGRMAGIAGLFSAVAARLEALLEVENQPLERLAFDDRPIFIGGDRPGPVRRSLKQRTQDEISDLLSVLYPGLHIHEGRVDGIRLRSRPIGLASTRHLEKLDEVVRVAVAPLSEKAQLAGSSCDPVPPKPERGFWLTGTGEEYSELAALDAAFDACYEARAAILVLPELRMPDHLDRRLRELLDAQEEVRILLVAAGSWHVKEGEGWRNRCRLYDHQGETIFDHDKLCEFRMTAGNVARDPGLRNALGLDEHGGFENIRRGEELRFCDTPIGRFTVAICAGFMGEPARAALRTVRADYYLVPAMSASTQDIADFAHELARHHGGSTAAANCGTVGKGEGSFVRSAGWKEAKAERRGEIYVYDLMEFAKLGLVLLSKSK